MIKAELIAGPEAVIALLCVGHGDTASSTIIVEEVWQLLDAGLWMLKGEESGGGRGQGRGARRERRRISATVSQPHV